MGRLTFTEYFHLLLTGEEPTEEQRFFLDLLLVSIAEHGLMPTNVAARMTLAADPDSLQGAVAAGILGCGPVILGTSEECARLLEAKLGREPLEIAREVHAAGREDPRLRPPRAHAGRPARRTDLRARGRARRERAAHELARGLRDAVSEVWGRPLTMNVSMPIASVLLDLGYPVSAVKAIRSSRAPQASSPTWPRSKTTRSASSWPRRRRRRSSTSADADSYRAQIAYLLERSALYREKLGASPSDRLEDIAELPLTDKDELRATVTPENPFGTHLCAEPSEIVRIYSTSGTTGAPSYIPFTADDVESWLVGSSRSYAASGVQPGQRIVSTYNAGPFVAGAALAAFERIGLVHVPVGTGNSALLVRAIETLEPEAVVMTPSTPPTSPRPRSA